ncbi:PhnF Transcriptional regulators [Rhabdaerophilaceae bacterium]
MVAFEPSKTQRIYLLLKEQILKGAVPAGHRLPSEPQLAASHRLSRVTIRRALEGLERDGLIRRQSGAGTFVLDHSGRKGVIGDLSNMLAHLVAMGRATRAKLLSFSYGMPPQPVAEALRLGPGERTQHSVRVRYIDDTPFSHLTTYVPERIGVTYSEADLASTPLLALLERSGVVADKANQTISATLAGPEISEILAVEIGSPLIAMTRVVLDDEGRGVEHLSALYRPDLHTFQMEMTRTGVGTERRWSPVPIMERKPPDLSAGKRRTIASRRRP